jgi:hypothetical protein
MCAKKNLIVGMCNVFPLGLLYFGWTYWRLIIVLQSLRMMTSWGFGRVCFTACGWQTNHLCRYWYLVKVARVLMDATLVRAFPYLRKAPYNFLMSLRPLPLSKCMFGLHWTDFLSFWYWRHYNLMVQLEY